MVKLNETDLRLEFKMGTGISISQFDIDDIKDENVIKYIEFLQEGFLSYKNIDKTIIEANIELASTKFKEDEECCGGCNCGE